ncbi:MAG: hypothetical protein WD069_09165 [Planctomycetales bacterium]
MNAFSLRALVAPVATALCAMICGELAGAASDLEEFRVKREQVFEFAEKPAVAVDGDRVTIAFATAGFCDVTVAIEDLDGRILRHLACGVLGPNAPDPFARNSKRQTLVWDGKDDAGRYVDDKSQVRARVSLGLDPRFERTLNWSPKKRMAPDRAPIAVPAPEGVYVYDGAPIDHVRLFDHGGDYVRTVYPFPAGKVSEVRGLQTHVFPHTGTELPLKVGFHQATLLSCGSNFDIGWHTEGYGVNAMGVHGDHVALLFRKLNRIATDGTSGGLPISGPQVGLPAKRHEGYGKYIDEIMPPRSAAFSPDGKHLYLTGFGWTNGWYGGHHEWLHCVTRMEFAADAPPQIFAGTAEQGKSGSDPASFNVPICVECDAQGRVYVADYMNDRIQVFDPAGKLLKSIAVAKPAWIDLHPATGEIHVFSWKVHNKSIWDFSKAGGRFPAGMTRLGPFDDPRVIAQYPLELIGHDPGEASGWDRLGGFQFRAAVDFWADPPVVWLSPGSPGENVPWEAVGMRLLVERDGKLEQVRDFGKDIAANVFRATPPVLWRQRLYAHPATHKLYVAEGDAGVMKSVKQVLEIHPESGKVRPVELPFDAEDIAFDREGMVYLRTGELVVRYQKLEYQPEDWREAPWDYGEEHAGVGFSSGREGRFTNVVGALRTPGHRSPSFWHMGGLDISASGQLVVTCPNTVQPGQRVPGRTSDQDTSTAVSGKPYLATVYPGRPRWGEVHVWDRHGLPIHKDVFPGIGHMDGIGIDADGDIYLMAAAARFIDGKKYEPELKDDLSSTLIKVVPREAKVVSGAGDVPVPAVGAARPDRGHDIAGSTTGPAWIENAEWFYGGLGYAGKNAAWAGGGCCCWNARFDLDDFARAFAPEARHFSIAVLDSAGNLILRIGRYGNVDDGVPLVREGGPPSPRSLGGDEVGLFHAMYLAADTDRRLFIADAGNARILSVKLDYHATETVPLAGAPKAKRESNAAR